MSESDDSAWKALMYARDDDDDTEVEADERPALAPRPDTNGRYTTVRQGFHSVRLPSPSYVEALEGRIASQERLLGDQDRRIRRLEALLRQEMLRHHNDLRNVRADLDGKVDRNWS